MLHSWILTMMKAGRSITMKAIKIILTIMLGFLAVTVPVYWFNLDTKLVKLIEKPMMRHYDNMKRDSRL